MRIYPIVTKVKTSTTMRRTRLLPHPGEVVVHVGQELGPMQVVARAPVAPRFYLYPASKVLDVPAHELHQYLLAEEGANLRKGAPLMRKPSLFGRAKLYNCPMDAVLYEIRNGTLILQQAPDLLELRAMIQARVVSIIDGRGAVLETRGSQIQGLWDTGKEGNGPLMLAGESPAHRLEADQIGAEAHGKVIVAGQVDRVLVLQRLEDEGARGLIVGSMPADLCLEAPEYALPIIVTDRIGTQPMAEPIFQLLKRSEGQDATLFARTLGTRAQRAEVIITQPATSFAEKVKESRFTLAAGQQVRVLRKGAGPHVGRVVRTYTQARKTAIGTRMAGADVAFPNGEVVFVPYTNLDLIVQR